MTMMILKKYNDNYNEDTSYNDDDTYNDDYCNNGLYNDDAGYNDDSNSDDDTYNDDGSRLNNGPLYVAVRCSRSLLVRRRCSDTAVSLLHRRL